MTYGITTAYRLVVEGLGIEAVRSPPITIGSTHDHAAPAFDQGLTI